MNRNVQHEKANGTPGIQYFFPENMNKPRNKGDRKY